MINGRLKGVRVERTKKKRSLRAKNLSRIDSSKKN